MPSPRNDDEANLTPSDRLSRGIQFLQQGVFDQAVEDFAAVVEAEPKHAQGWYCKGCAHKELGQVEEAIRSYEESIKFAGELAALPLYNLGNLYQGLGRLQDAAQSFLRATQVDPSMTDAWINLGRVLDDSGMHSAAVECYDVALQLAPDDAMAWSNRGNSLRSLDQHENALASYRKAAELEPQGLAARVGIGACLVRCGDPEQGIASLRELCEETGMPLVVFELATGLAFAGQHAEALEQFDDLAKHNFVTPELWNNRGECLAKLGEIEASLRSFDQALELDPKYGPALFGKARVLVAADRIDEARPIARQYQALASEAERAKPAVAVLFDLCGLK